MAGTAQRRHWVTLSVRLRRPRAPADARPDANSIFGASGLAAAALPSTLIKSLTYVLVLHPIAAGLGGVAVLFGLLSHLSRFSMIGLTTTFASIAGTVSLVAFIFDIVLFVIAQKRIQALGGQATLGNAIWITLVGMLLFMFSGCFFGIGRCVTRKQRAGREASDKTRPYVDPSYGQAQRQDAFDAHGGYGQGAMYGRKESGLPAFADRDGEIVPLTALRRSGDDEEESYDDQRPGMGRVGTQASFIEGVGEGYGRRSEGGIPVSLSDSSGYTAGLAGAGAGAGYAQGHQDPHLANSDSFNSNYSSTVAPFTSMQARSPSNLSQLPLAHYDASAQPYAPAPVQHGQGVGGYQQTSPPVGGYGYSDLGNGARQEGGAVGAYGYQAHSPYAPPNHPPPMQQYPSQSSHITPPSPGPYHPDPSQQYAQAGPSVAFGGTQYFSPPPTQDYSSLAPSYASPSPALHPSENEPSMQGQGAARIDYKNPYAR